MGYPDVLFNCPYCGTYVEEHGSTDCLRLWVAALFAKPDESLRSAVPENTELTNDDALAVVDKLREKKWLVNIRWIPDGYPWLADHEPPRPWSYRSVYVSLQYMDIAGAVGLRLRLQSINMTADSMPLGVYRVAAKAMTVMKLEFDKQDREQLRRNSQAGL